MTCHTIKPHERSDIAEQMCGEVSCLPELWTVICCRLQSCVPNSIQIGRTR